MLNDEFWIEVYSKW